MTLKNKDGELYGTIGEFSDVTALCVAAEKVRDKGYSNWDCHTPFPVHGLDDSMGIKMTKLPWYVLVMGATGCGLAILMQWWMNAVDYPYDISGKPIWSLPANVPIIFELTVLFSAFTTFFTMWILNGLPRWYNPLFRNERFARATDDKFFVAIEAIDPMYDAEVVHSLLDSLGARAVEDVYHSPESANLPSNLKGKLVVVSCLALVPCAMVYNSYSKTTTEPRPHLVPNMDKQDRFRAQGETTFFKDGRMARSWIDGTVAQGELPVARPALVDEYVLNRGQQRFNIYCASCHGHNGQGEGPVAVRAASLADDGLAVWVAPSDMTLEAYVQQSDEQLFETITNGVRTMPGYGKQITVEDRWAIVAYIRALQVAQPREEN